MRIGIRFFCLLLLISLFPVVLPAISADEKNLERVIKVLNENSIIFEQRFLLDDYGGSGSSVLVWNRATNIDVAGTFVLAVPLSADFAVDTAIAFAAYLKERDNPVNILLAFLGDEISGAGAEPGEISHKGLLDLLTLNDVPENWALCYMDIAGRPDEVVIRHGIDGYLTPLDIIKPLVSLFAERDISWSFRIRFNIIYKLGLVEGPEPLVITWGNEVNGFVLSGKERTQEAGSAGKSVSPHDLAALLGDFAASLTLPIINADRHYSTLILPGGNVFFISEMLTLVMLLLMMVIFLSGFLIYSARHYAKLFFIIRLFFGHIWIFFVSLIFLTICIKLSGFLYSRLLLINGSAALPNYAGLGLCTILAALFFYLPSPALDFIRIPKRTQLYGIAAFVFIAMGLFLTAFLDFSYVPFFLWAFFFVFIGAWVSSPVLVFICVFLVPFFAAGTLRNILETGYVRIVDMYISSSLKTENWRVAFMTALISLPVFLLAKRGAILIKKTANRGLETRPNRKYRLIAVPVIIAAVIGAMIIQIQLIPR